MRLITLLFSLLLIFPLYASDYEKEKRWAEQIEDGLMDGESIMLEAGEHEFYALYTEAEEPKETGIILMHGIGVHPDWPQVINPLRVELPEKGYSLLSIQLPVLANGVDGKEYRPLFKDVQPRIQAAREHLEQSGIKQTIIVAHSLGSAMASYSLAENAEGISGLIGIGMGPGNADYLGKINIPVLDLYGENDLEDVVKSADKRAKAAADNKGYSQLKIDGADHFFDDMNDKLLPPVLEWLDKQG